MSGALLVLVPLALCAALVGVFLFRASPRATFAVWLIVLFFLPVWVGASAGFFWAAVTLVTLLAIAASLHDVRLTAADGLMAAFALLCLVLFALRSASLSATVIALLEWTVPYIWGRLVLARVPAAFLIRAIAAVATAAALLALLEFATGTNVFVGIPGPGPWTEWSQLQPRASFLRAEGAFGHSIALGAALAMSAAFVIASGWRTPIILLSLAAIVGGIVVTFSRIGLGTAALTIGLSMLLLPGLSRALRGAIAVGAALAAAMILPFLGDVFLEAGDEAGGSADYRGGLLSLLGEVQILGTAGDWTGRTAGGVYLGAYARSVDNTLLVVALRFGWIPALLVLAMFVLVAIALIARQRADPASIAVAAQIPALFAVALITQFGMLLWFLVGVAVAWPAPGRDETPTALSARHLARRAV